MQHKNKKLSIGMLIALIGFPMMSETIYSPALPDVAAGLRTTAYMVETTLSIYFLGFAIGVLLWGMISDWSGRRKAMLMGIIVYGIGTLGCANVGSVEALLVCRLIQAFGASVGSVITQTMLRDSYEGTERTKLFSLLSGTLAFSPAVGPVLGGFISESLGWRANFWVLVALAIVLSIWSFVALPETRPAHITRLPLSKLSHLFFEMISSRALWGSTLLIGATNGILFGFYQEAPFVFIEQLGMTPAHYGLFGLLIAAASACAARISYRQSERFTSQFMIQCGASCVIVGGLLFTLAVMTGIFNLDAIGLIVTVLTLFLVFLGIGLIIPNCLSHALKPYQRAAGTAGSIFGGLYYCIITSCCLVMSLYHNGTAFPLPIYITILGGVLVLGSLMARPSQYAEQNSEN